MPTRSVVRRLLSVIVTAGVFTMVPFNPLGFLAAPQAPAGSPIAGAPSGTPGAALPTSPVAAPSLVPVVALASPSPEPTPPGPPLPESLTGYRWPLAQIRITQPFGPARSGSWLQDGKPFHDGLDLATFCGDHVRATHAGTVLAAGRRYDDYLGWVGDLQPYYDRLDAENLWRTLPLVVVIDDGNGYRSIYAHFSKVAVTAGTVVDAGAFLGWEGMSGNASGCHLHFGLFSPEETATLEFDPKLAAKMLLPGSELLRVDPQRVLPPVPAASQAPTTAPTP